jgi:hypothetical protein
MTATYDKLYNSSKISFSRTRSASYWLQPNKTKTGAVPAMMVILLGRRNC